MTPDPIREALRAELEATRAAYHALVRSITPEDWEKPTSNPAWYVGELLYHLSMAPRFTPEDIAVIRRLGRVPLPPERLFHRFNEWSTRRGARRAGLAGLGAAYDRAHARLLRVLDRIRPDEWQKGAEYPGWDPMLSGFVTIEDLFHYTTRHFHAHAAEIRAALGRE